MQPPTRHTRHTWWENEFISRIKFLCNNPRCKNIFGTSMGFYIMLLRSAEEKFLFWKYSLPKQPFFFGQMYRPPQCKVPGGFWNFEPSIKLGRFMHRDWLCILTREYITSFLFSLMKKPIKTPSWHCLRTRRRNFNGFYDVFRKIHFFFWFAFCNPHNMRFLIYLNSGTEHNLGS